MKNILYLFLTVLLFSCGDFEYVRFETAQPDGVKESGSFSRRVQGEYINCLSTDDRLKISDKVILNSRTFKFKSHRSDLEFDSTSTVNRESDIELTRLFKSEGYEIEIRGDSIYASHTDVDTIFQISENQILKKFKSSYFLNFKEHETFWIVKRLNLIKDTLLIGHITPSDTLLQFDFVVKNEDYNESDSTTITEYSINPSKREFKELMKQNSFKEGECYYKMK